VSLEISWTCEHNVFVGFTTNLAEGGVFVATHVVLPVGAALTLVLTLPGLDPPETVAGVVRWTRPPSEGLDVSPGMGVELVDPSPRLAEAIADYVAQREPLFYDD
jgi:uncharacterized protein (TIGR02266 family)